MNSGEEDFSGNFFNDTIKIIEKKELKNISNIPEILNILFISFYGICLLSIALFMVIKILRNEALLPAPSPTISFEETERFRPHRMSLKEISVQTCILAKKNDIIKKNDVKLQVEFEDKSI